MSTYEIEIKSLLGSKDRADKLKSQIKTKGAKLISSNKQLNHYFVVPENARFSDFEKKLEPHVKKSKKTLFKKILTEGEDLSIRTRETDDKILLVVKASVGDDTSANGVSRMEFESTVDMSLDKLDKVLLDAGLKYQAKWSREREEYKMRDVSICLDKNAGYGYLAEFEKVIPDHTEADKVKAELLSLMDEFEIRELMQDRLERMFAYYNSHWQDYYRTDKIFIIK